MSDPLRNISTRSTPQTTKVLGRPEQVANNAGGYVFAVDDETRLRRFLTLGSDGATYYASAADLTRESAEVVFRLAETDHTLLRNVIVQVSLAGRAPRQQATLFALAVASSVGTPAERALALELVPDVARTATMLFQFVNYVQQFRGWGRQLRRGVARWYTHKTADAVAYQAVKYRQREGWTHRDLLRQVHADPMRHPFLTAEDAAKIRDIEERRRVAADWRNEVAALRSTFDWITHTTLGERTPAIIEGFLKAAQPGADVPALVRAYRLSWEMLPDAALSDPKVWDALLDVGMGATALMRQLPRLTRLGLLGTPLQPAAGRTGEVALQLMDAERLKKGRVHPINVLVAQRTYASGRGARGGQEWTPSPAIVDALDAGFYSAFGALEPTGKRILQAVDVSGSMDQPVSNMPLTCAEAAAALTLVTTATEPATQTAAFASATGRPTMDMRDTALVPLPISPRQRLDDVLRLTSSVTMGGTDASMPILAAIDMSLEVDCFVVYTDSETWAGIIHPFQALKEYRAKSGIDAKLVVVGMTNTGFSIADPTDPGMLDVAGFDSAVPQLIRDFAAGTI